MNRRPLVAVDVGNSRTKLAAFAGPRATAPLRCWTLDRSASIDSAVAEARRAAEDWFVVSVHAAACERLLAAAQGLASPAHVVELSGDDFAPLRIETTEPARTGLDRIAAAAAANRLRAPDRAAAIVDLGTALRVDVVSADGALLGGAIAPGPAISARALHAFTDRLPAIEMEEIDSPPPPLGRDTEGAMRAGVYWSAVGAVRELVARHRETFGSIDVFLTGGAGPQFAAAIGADVRCEPYLVLQGVALAAGKFS